MANPVIGSGLVRACDELGCVEAGLDGFLGLIADKQNKQIRIGRDALFYAIQPLHTRMKEALAELNKVRAEAKRMDNHA